MITFKEISDELDNYINYACNSFSRNFSHLTFEDLKQESHLKILEIVRSRRNLNRKDIVSICKTSIFNNLRDINRKEIYRRTDSIIYETEDDSIITDVEDTNQSPIENIIFEQKVKIVKSRLKNDIQIKIFELMLEPTGELIEIAEAEVEENIRRKNETGKLVMNINRVKVMSKHICSIVRVSPATVSRCMSQIRIVVKDVFEIQ